MFMLFFAVVFVLVPKTMQAQVETMSPVTVTFAKTPNPHPVWGFGGEWDPQFWCSQNTRRGCNEETWQRLTGNIRNMGVSRVRMMIQPTWYEPENDNDDPAVINWDGFTWDTEHMQSMYRYLDFCQEEGIRVTLTWWCAPVRISGGQPYWLACQASKTWCAAPNNIAECAENVVAALVHLIKNKGYACIDGFTFCNEPDWTFLNDNNEIDFDYYAANCRAIDARLKAEGIRDKLVLDLADDSVHKGWLKQSVEGLQGVADRFNSHCYLFSCEDEVYPDAIRKWVREQVNQCGSKPFSTNELATRHYKGAYTATDVDTFERGFLVANYAILGMNEGMDSALFWGLHDQYYYDGNPEDGSNGGLMKTNLMAYVDEDWRLRPSGQAWTLVCHAAPCGAQVYHGQTTDTGVDAVALVLPENKGTNVLIVNRNMDQRHLDIQILPGQKSEETAYIVTMFTRDGINKQGAIPSQKVDIPGESLVLFSSIPD